MSATASNVTLIQQEEEIPMSSVEKVQSFMEDNPLTSMVGLWAGLMVGTGAYVWNRKSLSMSQKLIHSRLVAQAGVLAGVCSVAAVNVFKGKPASGVVRSKEEEAIAMYNSFDRPEFNRFASKGATELAKRSVAADDLVEEAKKASVAELMHSNAGVKR